MKRCPQCNRAETDDTLAFCRVDGATLVVDSCSIDQEAGTVKLGSGSVPGEVVTGPRPHTTNPDLNRATAPTTVLPPPQSTFNDFSITKKRRANPKALAVIGTLIVTVVVTVVVVTFRTRNSSAAIRSIAVMPFVNASGNADLEYLSDGMTEMVIRRLSLVPNLNVKARSTVFRYKGKDADAKTIGKELGVPAVLNGRLTQHGDQLTLNVELIDAQTENVIWTDQYDRKSSDIVSLQNEIARDVSSELKMKLSGPVEQKLAKNYTNDSEVFRLYLQGRYCLNKRVGKLYDQAGGYFQQAIEKDPNFALGYAALAEFIGERDRPKAKEYILRALAIDNQVADAHSTLGYQLMLDYDFAVAGQELERAIELDPKNARAYQNNGSRLMMLGKYDESLAAYDRAIEIEPTLPDRREVTSGSFR